jgi:hypothetical protein
MKKIEFTIEDDLYDEVESLSNECDCTIEEAIQEIIKVYLKSYKEISEKKAYSSYSQMYHERWKEAVANGLLLKYGQIDEATWVGDEFAKDQNFHRGIQGQYLSEITRWMNYGRDNLPMEKLLYDAMLKLLRP